MLEYKIFDHTADIGLEAYGFTLREAFVNAAKGMFSIISGAEEIRPSKSFSFEIQAETSEDLLVAWLNKLLYLYDAEKVILGHFEILKLEQKILMARVSGEPLQMERHKVKTYIKAATYHQANVKLNDICAVHVIFDV